jgi:hypothetical protein
MKVPFIGHSGGTMPEFETISLHEAQLRTIPGHQGRFLDEYASYIKKLTPGQAGKLHILEQENPLTIRRRLVVTAKVLGVPITIKRSRQEVYFWIEGWEEEKPGRKRSYTRRRRFHEDIAATDQPFSESEAVDQGVTEESPALGKI